MSKSKICFVVPRFHTNLFFATKALVEAGHEVFVICAKQAFLEDHSFVKPFVMGKQSTFDEVSKLLDEINPDLLFLRKVPPLSKHVMRYCKNGRLNVVHYDLKALTRRRGPYSYIKWKLRGHKENRVTPVRGADKQAKIDKAALFLPWPVETIEVSKSVKRTDKPFRVLCVGKLMQRRKNQDDLIKALEPQLKANQVEITLVGSSGTSIHGADENHFKRIEAYAEKYAGKIHILKDIPFEKVAELYASHQVCVLPAKGEPLGIAPIEAMAYGCVPIVTDDCGCAGHITDGVNGFVYPLGDVERLQAILSDLMSDNKKVKSLSVNTAKTAATDLSPKRFVKRVESLIIGFPKYGSKDW